MTAARMMMMVVCVGGGGRGEWSGVCVCVCFTENTLASARVCVYGYLCVFALRIRVYS